MIGRSDAHEKARLEKKKKNTRTTMNMEYRERELAQANYQSLVKDLASWQVSAIVLRSGANHWKPQRQGTDPRTIFRRRGIPLNASPQAS
jgi:hypothetical protein